jgi:CheY-like chemotaxis protein
MQVLIVDDNVMDRKCIQFILEQHLHLPSKIAKDGLDAINKIQKSHFDLVITDIVMPNVDGIELIRYLKSKYQQTKIIATTGNNPYYLQIANILGVDQYFTKPFDTEKITTYLNSLLKQYSKTKYA